jgi:hypothetical protein
MDSELRKAMRRVREREQAIWNRVEQIGKQARAADTKSERQSAATKADEDQRRERKRMAP